MHDQAHSDATRIFLTYLTLAVVATIANLTTQHVVMRLYPGAFNVLLSIFFGTGIGLILKYELDKRFIFCFRASNLSHGAQAFSVYTITGIATTFVFWGTEFAFHYLFHSDEMRYIGGIIGLAIGYSTKYRLDKHFVFRTRPL